MTSLATRSSNEALLKSAGVLAGRLGFAAAPTFALMAGIAAVNSQGMAMCSAATPLAPLDEMVLMYLLMSVFHLSPWLRLLSRRRSAPRHAIPKTKGH